MDINLEFLNNEYFSTKLENYLTQLFQINKSIIGIVLFGSLARGDAIYSEEKRSDIDLIIVFKDNELPEHHRKRSELKFKLMEFSPSRVDSLWMTESEFKNFKFISIVLILRVIILIDLDL